MIVIWEYFVPTSQGNKPEKAEHRSTSATSGSWLRGFHTLQRAELALQGRKSQRFDKQTRQAPLYYRGPVNLKHEQDVSMNPYQTSLQSMR